MILHQLDARRTYRPGGSPALPGEMTPSLYRVSLRSINAFAGAWSEGQSEASWMITKNGGSNVSWSQGDSGWKHIEQSFRILEIFPVSKGEDVRQSRERLRSHWIHCIRVKGSVQLPRSHKWKAFKLIEGRYTAAVTTSMTLKSPVYSITILFEDKETRPYQIEPELDQKSWPESRLQLGVCCKGITMFQLVLFNVIKAYAEAWSRSLDAVDQVVQVLVSWLRPL